MYCVVSVDIAISCWEGFLRSVVHPIQRMSLRMMCCVVTVMWMGILGVSMKKMKALSLKLETVTVIGKGR